MSKPKIIGGDPSVKDHGQCAECDLTFSFDDMITFLFMTAGNTIQCQECQTKHYIINRGGVFYALLKLGAVITTLFFGLLLGLAIPLSTYNASQGSFTVSPLMFIMGLGLGIIVSRMALKAYNWFYGRASTDPLDQSILDFGK